MNKKDVQLLLIVLGILAVVISWQFVYNQNLEETDLIETENSALRQTISELEVLEANKATYVADTDTMKQECNEIIDRFPADFLTEDEIMYLYNMENVANNQVVVPNISFGMPSVVPYEGVLTVDEYELQDEGISMMTAQDTISFTTTYTGLKNVIKYIYGIPGRKSISSVSLAAAADGYLSGTMSVDFYAITGTEKLYMPEDIEGVMLGKDNIFGVLNATAEGADE